MRKYIICCVPKDYFYFEISKSILIEKFYLTSTDNEIPFGVPFIFQHKCYSQCMYRPKENLTVVKELIICSEETSTEREVTCPACGCKERDSWEWDDRGERTCEKCYSVYSYEREIEITYSTRLIKRHAIKELSLVEKKSEDKT